jgi:hypothetical protein
VLGLRRAGVGQQADDVLFLLGHGAFAAGGGHGIEGGVDLADRRAGRGLALVERQGDRSVVAQFGEAAPQRGRGDLARQGERVPHVRLTHAELEGLERRPQPPLPEVDDLVHLVRGGLAEELGQDLDHPVAATGLFQLVEALGDAGEAHAVRAPPSAPARRGAP